MNASIIPNTCRRASGHAWSASSSASFAFLSWREIRSFALHFASFVQRSALRALSPVKSTEIIMLVAKAVRRLAEHAHRPVQSAAERNTGWYGQGASPLVLLPRDLRC